MLATRAPDGNSSEASSNPQPLNLGRANLNRSSTGCSLAGVRHPIHLYRSTYRYVKDCKPNPRIVFSPLSLKTRPSEFYAPIPQFLVLAAMAHTYESEDTKTYLQHHISSAIGGTDLTSLGLTKLEGKVRDVYTPSNGDYVVLVTTDRISAFDRVLANVPCKGQVLSQVSAWWFSKTSDIIDNHLIATPDPNVVIGKRCTVFPIEFVVRGYITGTTSTSMWTNYAKGVRKYCGLDLPDGLTQNQKLDKNVVTPTTKETEHDRLISPAEIVQEGWMSKEDYEYCAKKALAIFERGQALAAQNGLLLVDTKYEFGKDKDGKIILVDEIHTPDSSRYWMAESYEARVGQGLPPISIDKDVLRRWYNEHCDPYKDAQLPEAPADLIVTVATRYIELYERITGLKFEQPKAESSPTARILHNLSLWLQQHPSS